jgi:two-component system, OmpR family, alkaline phosphatase synthesis response regulator PhoP
LRGIKHTSALLFLKLLLIDNDLDVINVLSQNFSKHGYKVFSAANGAQGIELAHAHRPEIIITDLVMPEMDGVEVILSLRSQAIFQKTAIIVFTDRAEDYSIIAALDAGADEYVIKPTRFKILEAKIKAVLRRYEQKPIRVNSETQSTHPNFPIQFVSAEEIKVNGQSHILANKEIKLLQLLCSQPGRLFSREEIFQLIWNNSENSSFRTIDVHVRKLREKIGGEWIKTYKGVGYKLNEKLI